MCASSPGDVAFPILKLLKISQARLISFLVLKADGFSQSIASPDHS